ncbi:tyrosine-type recombinase/integrase [Microbacterium sp. LMI1x-1-1.1]|uniref:tyrosine-type recombinase/integrase n=1 Tax=Microbacterium sp. LMI1x-1-1.1 TaxID=3135246 RepID=UPI003429C223
MASIGVRRLPSGEIRYRVQGRHEGKQLQENFIHLGGAQQFKSLVERAGWPAARAVVRARRNTDPDALTLGAWTDKYLDPASGLLTGIEDATREGYRRNAERSFIAYLGQVPVATLTRADVGRWVNWQEQQPTSRRPDRPISAKTVRNYHALLSAVMTAAVDSGIRPDNPARKTRLTRGQAREGVFLSVDEYTTLLHFIPEGFTSFVMFLANTGCRWGEATALTWGDLDARVTPATIRVDKAWKKSAGGGPILKHPKSSRARRTISVPPDIVDALGKPGRSDALIFANSNGKHLWMGRFRASVWDPAVEKAIDPEACEPYGLVPLRRKPTPHDLRHSHASWLIAGGAPLPFVQARLGHESITTTINTYGHLQPDAHVRMADMIGAALAGTRPMRQLDHPKETL